VKSSVIARLERLESKVRRTAATFFHYGWLAPSLPTDYVGDRHLVVLNREPTQNPSLFWCQFEERPGPAPAGCSADFTVCLTTTAAARGYSSERMEPNNVSG
jgi:hypothetical protein